ncbi:DUF4307 domain-containing protein [Arthrobacter sp. 35W]|uniref:DUF4307 domain-containing protein n=1 Tax=Arthrobacter sp. 35W TaxID=1132441 RepID=UPI00047E5F08|nr:DUF4307 domain-containing protein [Arthrobacter sp. 35W]
MTVSNSSATTSVANRYGAPKRALGRRAKVVWLAVAAVLALAFVAWLALGRGEAPVVNKLVGYSVVDATLTEVDLQVTKDPADTAQCAVKAMDATYAVVGWNVATIGPNSSSEGSDSGRTTALRVHVRTDSPAVTGVVDSCWIVKQP